jgi:superfamily I DNA/RNA helicase
MLNPRNAKPSATSTAPAGARRRRLGQDARDHPEDRLPDPGLNAAFSRRNIAAITFTNKAAKEMQERVGQAAQAPRPSGLHHFSTFHSLGVRILREEAKALGYKPRFSIFDSTDCAGIISDLAGTTDKATMRRLQSHHLQLEERAGVARRRA